MGEEKSTLRAILQSMQTCSKCYDAFGATR
jgi:hypothetical protein